MLLRYLRSASMVASTLTFLLVSLATRADAQATGHAAVTGIVRELGGGPLGGRLPWVLCSRC